MPASYTMGKWGGSGTPAKFAQKPRHTIRLDPHLCRDRMNYPLCMRRTGHIAGINTKRRTHTDRTFVPDPRRDKSPPSRFNIPPRQQPQKTPQIPSSKTPPGNANRHQDLNHQAPAVNAPACEYLHTGDLGWQISFPRVRTESGCA